MMNTEERIYNSFDRVIEDHPLDALAINVADRNVEAIYKKTPNGLPPHVLRLRIGCIMMIIKNINLREGLSNGTRIQILGFRNNTIHCKHIHGPRQGQEFYLARHLFRYGGDRDERRHGAVLWERIQFPLRPGFVLTTNKSQGKL
jgi:ATP-dependent DNA helicase PIF1